MAEVAVFLTGNEHHTGSSGGDGGCSDGGGNGVGYCSSSINKGAERLFLLLEDASKHFPSEVKARSSPVDVKRSKLHTSPLSDGSSVACMAPTGTV